MPTYDGLDSDNAVVEVGTGSVGPPERRTNPGDRAGGGSASGWRNVRCEAAAGQAARAWRKKEAQGVSAVALARGSDTQASLE